MATGGLRAWGIFAVAAAVSGVAPSLAETQQMQRFFPGRRFLPRLVAAPREPITAAKLVIPSETPSRFGFILEAEADLGASIPVVILQGTSLDNAIVLGVEGGVFARFNLQSKERDLITTDWVFTMPVVFHQGGHWLQLRYFHSSAHLGDEYAERFNVDRIAHSRDALEATTYFNPVSTLGLYGGARWAFRVDPPEHKRWLVRGGAEFEDPRNEAARVYAAGDVELDQQYGWAPRLSVQIGVRVYTPADRPTIRAAFEFLTGPSPQGQFGGAHTTQFAVGVTLEL